MTSDQYQYADCTRTGIAVLTSRLVDRSSTQHAAATVNGYLDDGTDPAALFVGLVNVGGLLLLRLEELGLDPLAELQRLAAQVAADPDV